MVTVLVLDLGVKFIKHRQGCIVIRILTEVILSKNATQLILYSIILNNICVIKIWIKDNNNNIKLLNKDIFEKYQPEILFIINNK